METISRRQLLGGAGALGLIALAPAAMQVQERIDQLEEDVEDLQERVEALEEEAEPADDPEQVDSAPSAPAAESSVSLSGVGTSVTEKFNLEAGRYRATATVEVPPAGFSGFICELHGEGIGLFDSLLFNELIDQPGTWSGSAIFETSMDGEVFAEISNIDGAWTLDIDPY